MSDELSMDRFVRAIVDDVDEEIAHASVWPDFVEVAARAHAIDPDAVPEVFLAQARMLAPVVPLRASPRTEPDPGLVSFLDDVRADVDAAVTERAMGALPGPRAPALRGAWLAAAAAAAVLVASAAGAVVALRPDAAPEAMQAPMESTRAPLRSTSVPAHATPAPAPARTHVEPPVPVPVPVSAPETPRPATRTIEDRLRALDREAQRLWRAGDRPAAEAKYRALIRLARRGEWVELAYGDLFALAREEGGTASARVWREYLRVSPRGRHADDARAGLCRVAAPAERRRCWTAYLEDVPDGSYRRQAERALEEPPP
jgi:hypothetical protein